MSITILALIFEHGVNPKCRGRAPIMQAGMMTQTHTGKIALVTGANKGIGFEIARQLGAAGVTVYLGARDPELGEGRR
jgi:3-oxoacyl-ACP reductase-like protein